MVKLILLFLSLYSLLTLTLSCTCGGLDTKGRYCNSKLVINVNITGSDNPHENHQEQTNEHTAVPSITFPEPRDRHYQAKVLKVYKGKDLSEESTVALVSPGYYMCQAGLSAGLSIGSTYTIMSDDFVIHYCNIFALDDSDFKTINCKQF